MRKFHTIENNCNKCGKPVVGNMLGRKVTCIPCKKIRKSKYDFFYNRKDNHIKYRKQLIGSIICINCGIEKVVAKQRIGKQRFCSPKCSASLNIKSKPSKEECIRLHFGEMKSLNEIARMYKVSESLISNLFNKTYKIKPRQSNGSFIGKTPWNFVDGLSNPRKEYHTKEYKEWRKLIFERDNYTCVKCKNRGGKLNADHIVRTSQDRNRVYDIDNGQTLCFKCHLEKTKEESRIFWINQYSTLKG